MNKWNKVQDVLPDDHVDVLVYVLIDDKLPYSSPYEDLAIGYFDYIANKWELRQAPNVEYPSNYFEGTYKVLQWHKLPEKPLS